MQWDTCPSFAPCCSEYGYCRTKVSFIFISSSGHFLQEEWWKGSYRDCNGESNGTPLPQVIPGGVSFELYFVEVLFHIGRTDLKTTAFYNS